MAMNPYAAIAMAQKRVAEELALKRLKLANQDKLNVARGQCSYVEANPDGTVVSCKLQTGHQGGHDLSLVPGVKPQVTFVFNVGF